MRALGAEHDRAAQVLHHALHGVERLWHDLVGALASHEAVSDAWHYAADLVGDGTCAQAEPAGEVPSVDPVGTEVG